MRPAVLGRDHAALMAESGIRCRQARWFDGGVVEADDQDMQRGGQMRKWITDARWTPSWLAFQMRRPTSRLHPDGDAALLLPDGAWFRGARLSVAAGGEPG